jgi:hypothetical protein
MFFWTWRDSARREWPERQPISRQERLDFGQNVGRESLFSGLARLGVAPAQTAEREIIAARRDCPLFKRNNNNIRNAHGFANAIPERRQSEKTSPNDRG